MRPLSNEQRTWLCDSARISKEINHLQRTMIMNILSRSWYDTNESKELNKIRKLFL